MNYSRCLIIKIFSALMVSIVFTPLANADGRMYSRRISITIAVDDPVSRGREIIDLTEESGGHYLRYSDTSVTVRVPEQYFGDIEKAVKKSGKLTAYNAATEDLENKYNLLIKQLESREEIYEKLFRMLSSTDAGETINLEREIMSLVSEIERIKGQLRLVKTESETVRLEISYYHDEFPRPAETSSSFEWLNRINFYRFMGYGKGGR